MNMKINLSLSLMISLWRFSVAIPLSEVLILFGDRNCIAGSSLSLDNNNNDGKSGDNLNNDFIDKISTVDSDKSAMSYINELSQYNDISYAYELLKEDGPPHNKLFTIVLFLGDEKYISEEKSIKKAQQEAARSALKSTNYEHPPVKLKENEKPATPLMLLNNLAAKLGLSVTYTLVTDDFLNDELHKQNNLNLLKKSYLQKLNESVHSNDTIHFRKDADELKGPFVIRVDISGAQFFGKAHTIKNAKQGAAAEALKYLRENQSAFSCLKEDDNCKTNKQMIKSPISLVYEEAQRRNLAVEFEVVNEVGPSHKKLFTIVCKVGDLKGQGEGKSKKEAKKAAAENILGLLAQVPTDNSSKNVPVPRDNSNKKNKKKKKKNDKVIKTTYDKIDRMFDNVVDFGKGLVDSIRGNNNEDKTKSTKKNRKSHRSPGDELLQLGKILQLDIQFTNFEEKGKIYSLLDLGTKPSVVCLGEGSNQKNAKDLASKFGINVLFKLGLLDNLLDKSLEISNVLDKEETFDKFWLEVIENEEKEL